MYNKTYNLIICTDSNYNKLCRSKAQGNTTIVIIAVADIMHICVLLYIHVVNYVFLGNLNEFNLMYGII